MRLADFKDDFPALCDRLGQAAVKGRIGQAYLFVGDNAEFLSRFTDAWAQVCACLNRTPKGDACGACRPCQLFEKGSYAERQILRPESKSRQILIDDVREFEHQLGLSATDGMLKIGVIADAECLGEQAQNAFLKTLEEPHAGTLLLLHTTQARRLLPTIRSRCQIVSLLHNRRCYPLALAHGLFPELARLRHNAGAAVALSVMAHITEMFASLRASAEHEVGEDEDERWEQIVEADAALGKRLGELRAARIEAEYRRQRDEVLDAIHTWFLQQSLRAAGVADGDVPHPEMLQDLPDELRAAPSANEVEESLQLTDELLRCMATNAPEELVVETFCLSVARIRGKRTVRRER
ncbi:MAG: hypothetical protein KAI66_13010 [Lentisphaeria bacterium]|nr:hypothetical protein [Lentisphaeria bacterium]